MSSFNKQKRVFTLNDKAVLVLSEVTKSTKGRFQTKPEECPTTVASDATIVEMLCGKVTLRVKSINFCIIIMKWSA